MGSRHSRWWMGLDLGGGSLRVALLEADTRRVVLAARAWHGHADPASPVGHLFDPEDLWRRLREVVHEALARAAITASEVAALGCASLRHGSVLLGRDDRVLLATTNRDARGGSCLGDLVGGSAPDVLLRTGHVPHPVLPAARLRQVAREHPGLLAQARAHLALSGWVGWRLTGELASDPTQAGETWLFDLATRDWADDRIAALGLPRELFPAVREPGAQLGALRPDVAEELGLPPGLPIAVGGADTQLAGLGVGARSAGETVIVAGTTAPIQRLLDAPRVDARLWTGHAPTPGSYVLESNAGGLGDGVAWAAAALFPGWSHPVLALFDAATRSRPGACGVLCTLAGDRMDARTPELPVGQWVLSPMVASDDPDRAAHLARAVLEGGACALRANLTQLEEVTGAPATRLHLAGGMSRSAFFAQLVADVCAVPVHLPASYEGTAVGAALCGAVASGDFPSLAAAQQTALPAPHTRDPQPARERTDAVYDAWCAAREASAALRRVVLPHVLQGLFAAEASARVAARDGAHAAKRPRILVAADMDDASLAALGRFAEVEYASFRRMGRLLTGDALVEALRGFDVFVTEIDVVKADALLRCRDLRAIAVCRGDAVNVDLAACTALGIPVMHTPGRNADAVADLTLAFLLALGRKLVPANAFLREPGGKAGDLGRMGRAFAGLQGRELWHRSVGLVGFGAVGRKVAQRLHGFGARCLAFDPLQSDDAIRLGGAEPRTLDALLAESDFVSLHAPVTDQTRGLIGARELARMRAGAFLVNTARAALLDEDALLEAISSGHLGGAALDVFRVEPPASDHPLLALPQVIATPHVGGNTADVAAHQGEIVAGELGRLWAGERPLHVLNPEALAGFSWTLPRAAPPPDLLERLGDRPGPAVTDLQRDAQR